MVFWKGNGYLALVIPVMLMLIVSILFSLITGIDLNKEPNVIPLFIGLLISSFTCWKVGKRMNGGEGRILIDPNTSEKVLLKHEHTFWFIKLEYWGVIWGIISILVLFSNP